MVRRLPQIAVFVFVAYWLLLFVATHVPQIPVRQPVTMFDKVAHFFAYALLAWLAALVLRLKHRMHWGSYALLLAGIAAYAAVDEWLQPYFGRTADRGDWIADLFGAAAGLATFALAEQPLRRWCLRRTSRIKACAARGASRKAASKIRGS